ncbi:MAG: type II CAAX endopeptidase family protein [Phycisphaerales bacterium]
MAGVRTACCLVAALVAVPAEAAGQVGEGSAAPDQAWLTVLLFSVLAAVCVSAFVRVPLFRIPLGTGPATRLRSDVLVLGWVGAIVAAQPGAWAAASVAGAWTDWDALPALAQSTLLGLGANVGSLAWLVAILVLAGVRWVEPAVEPAHAAAPFTPPARAPAVLSLALVFVSSLLAWPVWTALGGIVTLIQERLGSRAPTLGHEVLDAMVHSSDHGWRVASMLLALVSAPVVEELASRGFLQQGIKRLQFSRTVAVLCTSAVFALMHWSVLPAQAKASGLTVLFTVSVLWGWLYERTGRLWTCMLGHALFNLANLLQALSVGQ